jgi:acylphosphatase
METIKGMVSGKVQGVGFRYFLLQIAAGHNLTGYCMNTDEGRVNFVIQGENAAIEQTLIEIEKGPMGSKVEKLIKSRLMDCEVFSDFSIRR